MLGLLLPAALLVTPGMMIAFGASPLVNLFLLSMIFMFFLFRHPGVNFRTRLDHYLLLDGKLMSSSGLPLLPGAGFFMARLPLFFVLMSLTFLTLPATGILRELADDELPKGGAAPAGPVNATLSGRGPSNLVYVSPDQRSELFDAPHSAGDNGDGQNASSDRQNWQIFQWADFSQGDYPLP